METSYASVSDLRAEGLDVTAFPDPRAQAALNLAAQFIERTTRQWFESRSKTLLLDGNDSRILHLPVPIISVSALYLNGDFTTPLPAASYAVYNRNDVNDDRRNPKIALTNLQRSIFIPPSMSPGGPLFVKGRQNQKVVGTFGFVESDGSCPLEIKRACLKMALRWVAKQAPLGTPMPVAGVKTGETTDGHSVQYALPAMSGLKAGTFAMTSDPEVDYILARYRAPLAIRVPGSEDVEQG